METLVREHTPARPSTSHAPEQSERTPWVPYIAEVLGTFGLVFAGCGAIVINTVSRGQITHVGVGLVFGLVITVMIYAFGHLSGAHFNPAVTLAFGLVRHFPLRRVVGYWIAQLVGAVLAALCLRLLFGNVAALGTTLPAGSGGAWQSFGLEVLLTFFLMLVIMAMATDTRAVGQAAALAIGATVGLEALFAGPISGASMNPARSLGPALVSFTWTDQWVYLVAPFVGAIAAAYTYRWLRDAQHWQTSLRTDDTALDTLSPHTISKRTSMTDTTPPVPRTFLPPYRVLFLCTHNSSRSQMAEGLLRARGGSDVQVFSAGTHPRQVHPLAIRVMAELGIDISERAGHAAKGVETFTDQPAMNLVVTVCDEAAEECPYFPNAQRQVHWGFPDPSGATGTEEERLAVFRHVRDLIAARLNAFVDGHELTFVPASRHEARMEQQIRTQGETS